MFAKWIRNLIASSLYKEIRNCTQCEMVGGFNNYNLCSKHEKHIDIHNVLTSINNG